MMRTVRALHIYRAYFPESQGGLEESIRQLCLATQPLGVENTIFTLATHPDPAELELPEGRVVRSRSITEVASCNIGGWDSVRRCRELSEKADVIHVHYPWPFADLILPFVRRKGQPLVVTYVSDVVRQRFLSVLHAPVRDRLLRSADAIVASSPNYARTSPVLIHQKNKLTIIPHCLEECPPQDQERIKHWREKLGENFFLFIGVMRYYKGLEYLLEAAKYTNAEIVLIGSGPKQQELMAHARRENLRTLRFLGALDDADKFAITALCRGIVFPSHLRSEAFGMTLLEGARTGKPLISCEIGTGTSWINIDGETGYVVPPKDPSALAEALNKLSADQRLCERMGESARKRWLQLFSPSVVGTAYRDLYDRLLTR